MPDISAEIAAFRDAAYGEEVRGSMISLAQKLNGNILSELATMEQTWNAYKDDIDADVEEINTFLPRFYVINNVFTNFDDWHLNSQRTKFLTSDTYTRGPVVFSNLTFEKGKSYVFEISTGELLPNNGYCYMRKSDSTLLNTFRMDSGTDFCRIDYTPGSTYQNIDIVVGFSKTNVLGFIRLYEEKITIDELSDAIIEENEVWS